MNAVDYRLFFPEKGIVTQAATSSDKFKGLLDSRDTVYVVDGKGVLSRSARTFVFTLPNPGSYNEYLKDNNSIFYSKVWSKSEILAARQLLFKDIVEHRVLELYRKWGGVPRHVLEKAENVQWQNGIESKAQSVQGSQWLKLLTNLGRVGRVDRFEVSEVVLHYRTEDYMQYEVVFASSYVSQLAYSKLRRHNWVETLRFLQSNDFASASNRGILFERFAHNVLGRKCNVRVRSLEERGQSKIESLEWPLLKHRTFRKLSFKGDLVEEGPTGSYWEPESKNNAAFDAVCSNIGDDLGTVAALQMTISKNHGIQHDGLVKLLEAAPSVKRLYFVVPRTIFEEFQKQRFTKKQRVSKSKDLNERTLRPSDSVSGVEQWALEVEWDYAPTDP